MPNRTPAEFVAEHSVAFANRHLPCHPARILDVGCGTGEVAAELVRLGHEVTPIDVDADSLEAARQRGLDAELVSIHDFRGGPFDAILFAYSLHHIERPVAALAHAVSMLAPGGRVLVLEMAFHELGERSLAWVRSMDSLVLAAGITSESCYGYFDPDRAPGLGHEHQDHQQHDDHVHHPSDHVRGFVEQHLEIVHQERAPLVYAFWADSLPDDAGELCEHLYELERIATEAGAIGQLGVRWVAVPRP